MKKKEKKSRMCSWPIHAACHDALNAILRSLFFINMYLSTLNVIGLTSRLRTHLNEKWLRVKKDGGGGGGGRLLGIVCISLCL